MLPLFLSKLEIAMSFKTKLFLEVRIPQIDVREGKPLVHDSKINLQVVTKHSTNLYNEL